MFKLVLLFIVIPFTNQTIKQKNFINHNSQKFKSIIFAFF